MRFVFNGLIAALFFAFAAEAQEESTRVRKLQKIYELNNQLKSLEQDFTAPDATDFKRAQTENSNVFRLMPREKYDGKLSIRGGAAYYSFARKTAEYGSGSDIELSQNFLSVGFAGADYGFIFDLGDVPLQTISRETTEASFLVDYNPPPNEREIRIEQRRARAYEANGFSYKNRVPALVGHAYLLRSINFDRSDVLVAFKIARKDADGSLIIFWKNIAVFEAPQIIRNQAAIADAPPIFETATETVDYEILTSLQNAFAQKRIFNISVDATNKEITLRGNVPKGKLAEVIVTAQEIGKRKVINQLIEQ